MTQVLHNFFMYIINSIISRAILKKPALVSFCYFEVFEKLTRACFFQIALKIMLLPIQIYIYIYIYIYIKFLYCRYKKRRVSLWRRACARNVRLRFLYRQYTNILYFDLFLNTTSVVQYLYLNRRKLFMI